MNERIQELAYEAEDYADGIVDQGGEFHPAYTEKLAELIVRECIEQAHKVSNLRGITDDMIYGADTAAVVISKHFEVK